jgi:hypothetical protein
LAAAIIALAASAVAQPKSTPHVSREAAIQLLKREGIMSGTTRVVSADWHEDIREWLIILQHPAGKLSAWFVDAKAENYHGGPCTQ